MLFCLTTEEEKLLIQKLTNKDSDYSNGEKKIDNNLEMANLEDELLNTPQNKEKFDLKKFSDEISNSELSPDKLLILKKKKIFI